MTVRVAFLGDTLLGGEAHDVLQACGYGHALGALEPLLSDADLVVANHEGPLTTRSQPDAKLFTGKKRYWYKADPGSVDAMVQAGVGVVSLANNHVCDFGAEGLADTIANLEQAGIAHCGAGPDDARARRPAIVDIGGLRIGFLSVMQRYHLYIQEGTYATASRPGPARLRLTRLRDDIAALRERVDLCVVLVHWGRNYLAVTPRQQRLAREMVIAGAQLVVGHHPHIPQRIEILGNTPVLYSLGNGALGTPGRFHSGRPPYGLIAIADITKGRVARVHLRAIHVDNAAVQYRPTPADDHQSSNLLHSLIPADINRTTSRGGVTIEIPRGAPRTATSPPGTSPTRGSPYDGRCFDVVTSNPEQCDAPLLTPLRKL